ncbi:MAG: hypothetical protein K8J08_02835 [Thermoanaerobaculia bacterium]|nr:hypothetical protein [Thermoanaerobaculia bacterium]
MLLSRFLVVSWCWVLLAGAPASSSEELTHVEIRAQIIECRWIAGELNRLHEEYYDSMVSRYPELVPDGTADEYVWERVRSVPNYVAVLHVKEARPLPWDGVLSEWESKDHLEHALLAPDLGTCQEGLFIEGALFQPSCDTRSPACLLKVKTLIRASSLQPEVSQRELKVTFGYYNRVRWQSFGAGVLAGLSLGGLILFAYLRRK